MMFSLSLTARDIMINVKGRTLDNLTGENIGDVTLVLMNADSIPIDTMVSIGPPNHPMLVGMFAFKVGEVGKYIIHASAVGYKDAYANFRVRSRREWLVRVKATKIKMIYSGDTIVYNADAFKMADGSMLDELIRRLPSATLSADGRIYVNGHYVENLLVNGKDFFGGNAQVALENLPAYTVKRIKVFDRMGADSKLMGRDMHDKQYVMDVRLKKEYSVGYMGNLEAGGGTDHRYMLRDFGMKFSEASRLLAFANVNNLSNDEVADVTTGGGWSSLDTPQGLLVTQAVGLSYLHMFGNETSYIGTNNLIKRTDADNQSATHTQTSTAATALATPPTRSATRRQGSTRKRCSNCSSGNGPQRTFSRCNTTTTRDGPHRRARRSWEANGSTPC